jgi:hypothetical protein
MNPVRLIFAFLGFLVLLKGLLWTASWPYSTESAIFGAAAASLLEAYNREERMEELAGILRVQRHLDGLHCHSASPDCVAKCIAALHDQLMVTVLSKYSMCAISDEAAQLIQQLCRFITELVSEEMLDKRAKIQISDVQCAVLRTLPQSLHTKCIAAGSTAVEHFRRSEWCRRAANVRISIAAGLYLSVEHTKQWMDQALSVQQQFGWALVELEGAVYLAGVLQYVAADVLEHTVEYMAIARRSKTDMMCMQPELVCAAMNMDHTKHLHQLYAEFMRHQIHCQRQQQTGEEDEEGEDEEDEEDEENEENEENEEDEPLILASARIRRRAPGLPAAGLPATGLPVLAAEEPGHM